MSTEFFMNEIIIAPCFAMIKIKTKQNNLVFVSSFQIKNADSAVAILARLQAGLR